MMVAGPLGQSNATSGSPQRWASTSTIPNASNRDERAKIEAVPSSTGNERIVMDRVAGALESCEIDAARLERLKTAVAEATMNAIEHGNAFQAELPVEVRLYASETAIRVLITDHGGEGEIPEATTPDLDAKLAGLQSPRGWGLFLIQSMVDAVTTSHDGDRHTIELVLHTEGDSNASHPV
jgi:anti-sigma regulatory factor (Ser/Thr protein kinase)